MKCAEAFQLICSGVPPPESTEWLLSLCPAARPWVAPLPWESGSSDAASPVSFLWKSFHTAGVRAGQHCWEQHTAWRLWEGWCPHSIFRPCGDSWLASTKGVSLLFTQEPEGRGGGGVGGGAAALHACSPGILVPPFPCEREPGRSLARVVAISLVVGSSLPGAEHLCSGLLSLGDRDAHGMPWSGWLWGILEERIEVSTLPVVSTWVGTHAVAPSAS